MAGISTAGVEFSQSLMRYAEVEQNDGRHRLVRLGSCEFGFDATHAFFERGTVQFQDAIRDAMADIFRDTTASRFSVVIPSTRQTRFASMIPADADAALSTALVGYDADLFTEGREGGDVFPVQLAPQAGAHIERYAVSHVDASVSGSLSVLQPVFPDTRVDMLPSMSAALIAYRAIVSRTPTTEHPRLLIGVVDDGFEVMLLRGSALLSQEFVQVDAAATLAYRSLLCCHRSGFTWEEIDRVLLYGLLSPDRVSDALEEAFGPCVERINPGVVVGLEEDHFGDDYPIASFLPVVGAALHR